MIFPKRNENMFETILNIAANEIHHIKLRVVVTVAAATFKTNEWSKKVLRGERSQRISFGKSVIVRDVAQLHTVVAIIIIIVISIITIIDIIINSGGGGSSDESIIIVILMSHALASNYAVVVVANAQSPAHA